jgi:hypothetical protein
MLAAGMPGLAMMGVGRAHAREKKELQQGHQVFVVADASGTFNKQVADAALIRMAQAGAVITNWFAVACELQRAWRKSGEGLANLFAQHLPAYKNLITRHGANTKK